MPHTVLCTGCRGGTAPDISDNGIILDYAIRKRLSCVAPREINTAQKRGSPNDRAAAPVPDTEPMTC